MSHISQDKAFVVNKYWAGLLSSIMGSAVIGGIAYAWAANAQIAVLQRDVDSITGAKLEMRLTRMEEQVKAGNEKLDYLVNRVRR